jgi:hypothetical protein
VMSAATRVRAPVQAIGQALVHAAVAPSIPQGRRDRCARRRQAQLAACAEHRYAHRLPMPSAARPPWRRSVCWRTTPAFWSMTTGLPTTATRACTPSATLTTCAS